MVHKLILLLAAISLNQGTLCLPLGTDPDENAITSEGTAPDTDVQSEGEEVFLLPAPSEESGGEVTKLSIGETVSMDEMGPMVINKDGTISRITNWDVKLPHEKEAILKVISKRNAERRKILEEKALHVDS